MCPSFSDLHSDQTPARHLALNCWFKINTDSASSPSSSTECGCLSRTQCTLTTKLSVSFCVLSISFITAYPPHVCHYSLRASSSFSAGLLNCLCQSLHLSPLTPTRQSVSKQLELHASSMWTVPLTEILSVPLLEASRTRSSLLKSHTCSATLPTFLHNKPTINPTMPQLTFDKNTCRIYSNTQSL